MSNFKVGQKVVCVNAKEANKIHPSSRKEWKGTDVLQNEIYKISNINNTDGCWLMFEETGEDTEYEHWSFRPLQLDYDFVEEVIKQIEPQTQKI